MDGGDADFRHLFATVIDLIQRHLTQIVGDVHTVTVLFCQVETLLPSHGVVEGLRPGLAAYHGNKRKHNLK